MWCNMYVGILIPKFWNSGLATRYQGRALYRSASAFQLGQEDPQPPESSLRVPARTCPLSSRAQDNFRTFVIYLFTIIMLPLKLSVYIYVGWQDPIHIAGLFLRKVARLILGSPGLMASGPICKSMRNGLLRILELAACQLACMATTAGTTKLGIG